MASKEAHLSAETLNQEVVKIRAWARDAGLSDRDIGMCINKVLGIKQVKEKRRIDLVKTTLFVILPLSFVILTSLLCCTYIVLSTMDETTAMRIFRPVKPLFYHGLKIARRVSSSLHNYLDITEYYDAECLVDNPLFEGPADDCPSCVLVTEVEEFAEASSRDPNEFVTAVIYRNYFPTPVSYTELRRVFLDHATMLEDATTRLDVSNSSIDSMVSLLSHYTEEDIAFKQEAFSARWMTARYAANQALRLLFHRPAMLDTDNEIALAKILYLEGPNANSFSLPSLQFSTVLYRQDAGIRDIKLSPVPSCSNKCQELSLTLNPGDLLLYNDRLYHGILLPFTSKQVSLGYMGSFM